MVRLHERALLLIIGLERGALLAKRLRACVTSAVGPVARRLPIRALRQQPAAPLPGQRPVERDQRFALKRAGRQRPACRRRRSTVLMIPCCWA